MKAAQNSVIHKLIEIFLKQKAWEDNKSRGAILEHNHLQHLLLINHFSVYTWKVVRGTDITGRYWSIIQKGTQLIFEFCD